MMNKDNFIIDDGVLIKYTGNDTIVSIPEDVTLIERSAFSECENLKTIKIPNTITRIDDSAFSCCRSLKEVILPDSIEHIGHGAFYNCESLKEITIVGIGTISSTAFKGCKSLEEVNITMDNGTGFGSIEWEAFSGCCLLKKLSIKSPSGALVLSRFILDNYLNTNLEIQLSDTRLTNYNLLNVDDRYVHPNFGRNYAVFICPI